MQPAHYRLGGGSLTLGAEVATLEDLRHFAPVQWAPNVIEGLREGRNADREVT